MVHKITLTEDQRLMLIKLLSETPAYDKEAGRLLNKLKDLKGED